MFALLSSFKSIQVTIEASSSGMKMEIFIFERILLVQISPLPIFRHDTAYVFVHLLYQHVLTRPIRACVEAALAR